MKKNELPLVKMIPIAAIRVAGPRSRGRKKHQQITENIGRIGLKRPIEVSPVEGEEGTYQLLCGQGRLESFIALGQTEIPALIRHVSKEEQLLMSFVENGIRRRPRGTETIRDIVTLKDRGYSAAEIARKTDLGESYVVDILRLFERGEERLIDAVEGGRIPITIAMTIAGASDKDLPNVLQDAYEQKKINGKVLQEARNLGERRRLYGKGRKIGPRGSGDTPKSAEALLQQYDRDVKRRQLIIKKASLCERRLLIIASALKPCFADENFVNLLRVEGLLTLPKFLAERIQGNEA